MSIQEKIEAFAPQLLGLKVDELIAIGENYQRLFFNSDFVSHHPMSSLGMLFLST